MKTYQTKYGLLKGISEHTFHDNQSLKECVLEEEVKLHTPSGELIPCYSFQEHRRKRNYSLTFHRNGTLRRISLEERIDIMTPIGLMPVELILFYESGNIKKVFPLNGHLSAYWEENDEYQLAVKQTLKYRFGEISAKMISISFYENGAIKDVTLWPQEVVNILTPCGQMKVRKGIAFYPNGGIKSVEPAEPVILETPIGKLAAYDENANGISGDVNSLNFTMDGDLKSLVTSENQILVYNKEEMKYRLFSPEQITDADGLEIYCNTLLIEFFDGKYIRFQNTEQYDMKEACFLIQLYRKTAKSMCGDCSSCSKQCKMG